MFWFSQSVLWIGIFSLISVCVFLVRNHLYPKFPLFSVYVAYMALVALVQAAFLAKPNVYFYVYWYSEPGAFLLRILAVHESFMHVFRSFYLLRWFRILLPTTIVLALIISGGHAYFHPAHGSRMAAVIIGTAVTSQYIVLAISILFFLMVVILRVHWRIHEYRIVLGFGLSAIAISFAGSVRSEFGTRFEALSGMLPGMAYLAALVIWLTAVRHPQVVAPELSGQISWEPLVQEARRQLRIIRSLLHRG
jgi:hypothetical protein